MKAMRLVVWLKLRDIFLLFGQRKTTKNLGTMTKSFTRDVVESLFRRMNEFHKVFTRYDKLDVMSLGFVYFSIIWLN